MRKIDGLYWAFITATLLYPVLVLAEFEWISYTIDNDLFLGNGNDSGYTNGMYFSLYELDEEGVQPQPSWMLQPLLWSLPAQQPVGAVNSYTIGQTINTPEDITIEVPSEEDLPYAGLLFVNNTHLSINKQYADKISTTIGVVGSLSLAEQSQNIVHALTGSDEAKGWDTQLENELVFQFSRARSWRTWASESEQWDFITSSEFSIGTISSRVDAGVMLRYGENLMESYAIPLLDSSRTTNPTNPVAINGDWYVYSGITIGYIFNQIFTDGNTFRDSRSIDYDHDFVRLILGIAYSWSDYSLAFALNDSNIISDESEEHLKDLTQYGSLTFAVKFE